MHGSAIFGAALRELRVKHRLTQKEVARRLERGASTISHWETGETILSIDQIEEYLSVFDMVLIDFLSKLVPDWQEIVSRVSPPRASEIGEAGMGGNSSSRADKAQRDRLQLIITLAQQVLDESFPQR